MGYTPSERSDWKPLLVIGLFFFVTGTLGTTLSFAEVIPNFGRLVIPFSIILFGIGLFAISSALASKISIENDVTKDISPCHKCPMTHNSNTEACSPCGHSSDDNDHNSERSL